MRIGLMGGTFDPIHIAHLVAASEVHQSLQLDQIIFIPAGQPWQKAGTKISPGKNRLEMVKIAIQSDSRFSASDIEIKRPGDTYAIDTVRELTALNPANAYYWIVGSDALAGMSDWKDFNELKSLIEIVAVNRNGISKIDVNFGYTFVPIPEINISATEIRSRVIAGKPIRYLVSEAVEKYILDSGLYK